MQNNSKKVLQNTLGFLLLFIALNAFGGGYYGMAGAENVPVKWLEGSPFNDYFFPGLFLFVVIGGSTLLAAILVFRRNKLALSIAFIAAIIILLWIITQVIIIGYLSWMQPATTIAALIVILLTRKLFKLEY